MRAFGNPVFASPQRAEKLAVSPCTASFVILICIRFEDVVSVEFSRTGASTTNRFFAFTVSCRGGVEHEFTSIDRNEYNVSYRSCTLQG